MSLIPDRSSPPVAHPLNNMVLPPYETQYLSNGTPVFLLQYGETAVLNLTALFKAGSAVQQHIGTASYTARNMLEGTRQFTSLAIAQQLDSFGSWIYLSGTL